MTDQTAQLLAMGEPTYPRIAALLRAEDRPVAHAVVVPIVAAHDCRTARQLREARGIAREKFCTRMGWTRGEPFSSQQLREARGGRDDMDASRLTAHQNCPIDRPEYFYEGLVPVAIVSHTLCPLEHVWNYAEFEGLRAEVLPGSWDRPGERSAIVFMREGYKSRYEK
jgi:hypothetical protein